MPTLSTSTHQKRHDESIVHVDAEMQVLQTLDTSYLITKRSLKTRKRGKTQSAKRAKKNSKMKEANDR